MADKVFLLTPVGRIVQGSLWEPQTKDHSGRPLEKPKWFVGLAIPKGTPETEAFIQQVQAKAMADFPNGEYNAPAFAWKMIDGDGVDAQGQPYAGRTGFAGHIILRLTSGFAPEVYDQQVQRIMDPSMVKRGYYVQVNASIQGNGDAQKPGVYINLGMTQLCGYGEEITSGPAATDVFGTAPAALPAGASATPLAPAAGMPAQPGVAPLAQPMAQPGMAPAPVAAPQPATVAPAPMPGAAPIAQPQPVSAPVASSAPGTMVAPGVSPAGVAPGVAPNPAILNPQQ